FHGVEFRHLGSLVFAGHDAHAAESHVFTGGYVARTRVSFDAYQWPGQRANHLSVAATGGSDVEDLCASRRERLQHSPVSVQAELHQPIYLWADDSDTVPAESGPDFAVHHRRAE